jgi:hypothetical protein
MHIHILVEVLWIVTLCTAAVGYQRFGGPCRLHLHGECPPKRWYLTARLTQRRNPQDLDVNLHRRENRKSRNHILGRTGF